MHPMIKSPIRVVMLALAALLVATPAAAQQVDAKGEKELTTTGQKVDKASASANSGHVTAKIVDQWQGTQFRFDTTTAPRELTAQDVQGYRAKGLGYGEISILLAMAAKQDSTSPKSVDEILAMRQGKMGWGNIAKELGYKSLGAVQKSVKATEVAVEKVSAGGKPEKVSKVDKSEKSEKAEKLEKPERVRVERPERPEKPGR